MYEYEIASEYEYRRGITKRNVGDDLYERHEGCRCRFCGRNLAGAGPLLPWSQQCSYTLEKDCRKESQR